MGLIYFKIGILVATISCIFLQSADAGDKKVTKLIIKVPTKIKHVYHQHTKKVHIHKHRSKPTPKPKPIIVNIKEETKWKPDPWEKKVHYGRSAGKSVEWKGRAGFHGKQKGKGYSSWNDDEKKTEYEEEYGAEESKVREDYYGGAGKGSSRGKDKGWSKEVDEYGGDWKPVRGKQTGGSKSKGEKRERCGKGRKSCEYDEQSGEASSQEDWVRRYKQKKPKSKTSRRIPPNYYPTKYKKRRPHYEEDSSHEDSKESVWPEMKEHPSWHQYRSPKSRKIPVSEKSEDMEHGESFTRLRSDINLDDYINSGEYMHSHGSGTLMQQQWQPNYYAQTPESKTMQSVSPSTYYANEIVQQNSALLSPAQYISITEAPIAFQQPQYSGQNAYNNQAQSTNSYIQIYNTNENLNHHQTNLEKPLYNYENTYQNNQPQNFKNYNYLKSETIDITSTLPPKKLTTSLAPYYHALQTSQYQITSTTPIPKYQSISESTYTSNRNTDYSIGYKSHIGHNTNGTAHSTSFQEVIFGNRKTRNRQS
ncbi:hypothetical protein O3M35_001919 [Rhynocoris fuscipes]|uniref:Uncharacterized protein n=1 Tax=Rhynocoris fuscipes TaxID=488301 RepID=A0AAW1CV31_9HEMI